METGCSGNGTPKLETRNAHPAHPTVELDPDKLLPAPGNAPVTLEAVTSSGLLASITEQGQLVDGIAYTDATLPPGFDAFVADGNGRAFVCGILGRKFRARLLDHAPTKAELRRIRVATWLIRKDKDAGQAQLASDLLEHMEETGQTQELAASDLGISPGYASKVLAPLKRLCADLQHLRENKGVPWYALRIIATMPTEELQKKLADRALATIAAKHKLKRDSMERWARELRGQRKPRDKPMKFCSCSVSGSIKGNPVEALRALRGKIDEVLKQVDRNPALADALPSLLKGTG